MNVDEAFKNMKHSFVTDRFGQGYIIAGRPREEGSLLAEMVMGLFYCVNDDKPCGHCDACVRVHNRTHPDVLWVEPEKKSRRISIDQIRGLQKKMMQTSFAGGWKVCILIGADRLGVEASNAFLKMLEEPPAGSVFFLLTDSPQFLLPTIVSRCQRVALSADDNVVGDDFRGQVAEILCRVSGAHAVTIFAGADGFTSFLKEIRESIREEEMESISEESSGADDDVMDARIVARYKESRMAVMRIVYSWYRDILVMVCGMDDVIINRDSHDFMLKKAKSLTFAQALNNVQVVENMNRQLEYNLPEGLVMGAGFSRLV